MDILKAYEETLAAARDLRPYGIEVEITPSKAPARQKEDPLPRDKWVDITFRFKTRQQADIVKKRADELGWAGITFDTSGTKNEREWQIDWSFQINPVPDGEWEARREDLEDMIEGMGSGGHSGG